MDKLYLFGCLVIAGLVPIISSDSVSGLEIAVLQVGFIALGIAGWKTFQ